MRFWNLAACVLMCGAGVAEGQKAAKAATVTAGPVKAVAAKNGVRLTIYNQDFAEVRTPMEVELKAGMTEVSATNVTAEVELDSVVLRDTVGKTPIRIVEQSARAAEYLQMNANPAIGSKTVFFKAAAEVSTALNNASTNAAQLFVFSKETVDVLNDIGGGRCTVGRGSIFEGCASSIRSNLCHVNASGSSPTCFTKSLSEPTYSAKLHL